jgi:hypothetical protein
MPRSKGDAKQSSASREDAIDRPLEYLFTSSEASIESFHLTRLNRVANLRKELHEIFEEWVEAEVQARLAQWLLARKNPERSAAAHPATIDSLGRSAARRTIRPAARLTAIHSISRAATLDSDSAAQPALARAAAACRTMQSPALVHPHSILNPGKHSKALLRSPMNSSRTPPAVNKQPRNRLTPIPFSRCK